MKVTSILHRNMKELLVVSDIPIPKPRAERMPLTEEMKRDIVGLEVGESFALIDPLKVRRAMVYGRSKGLKLIRRKQGDGMIRIWRVA